MSIPTSFNPLGTLGAVTELDSCGIAHNAKINTGINGQVRNMRLVLHVGGVPLDGTIGENYTNVIGCSGGCRRYIRFGTIGGSVARVFSGSAASVDYAFLAPLASETQLDVTYGTTNVTGVVNGKSYSGPFYDFTEPAGEVQMFFSSSLRRPVVFRFYRAKVYLNGELSADIVPAQQDEKIILWDKVRRVMLEPTNSPLLP